MTQQEVKNLLEKTEKWMTTKEIAKKLNKSTESASENLRKMFNHGEVHRKYVKINMRLDYVWRLRN